MNLRTKNIGSNTIVRLSGRLDIFESEMAEKDISILLDKNPDSNIVLVLEDLDYLSSSGLRIFISLKRKLESQGLQLALCNRSNNAVNIFFKIVNIKDMFNIYQTEDQALQAINTLKSEKAAKIA